MMMESTDGLTCRLCGFLGSDVRLENCGCTLHARCVPISLIVSSGTVAAPPNTQPCPCCRLAPVSRLYLFPVQLDDLDRASRLRRLQAEANAAGNATNEHGKRERAAGADLDLLEVQSESPYLLLLGHNSSGTTSGAESEYLRTGRWTEDETAYVDFLVENFDRGQLIMPQGIRLNDMLRDLLLCKVSRLTKKMKHAKLSARSYVIQAAPSSSVPPLNRVLLSTLENNFLGALPETSRLELRCIVSKAWRTFLSDLCLQVGSEVLKAHDWMASLETCEARASQAEQTIRLARRRRMGLALKTDVRSARHGIFISGMPPDKRPHTDPSSVQPGEIGAGIPLAAVEFQVNSSTQSLTSSQGDPDSEYIAQILDFGETINQFMMGSSNGNINYEDNLEPLSMHYGAIPEKGPVPCRQDQQLLDNSRYNCGPFLDAVVTFIENKNLPFEHIDVWVPSFNNAQTQHESTTGEMRLFHAGYVTRSDIDPARFVQLNEYGEYSTKFSFRPGCGLPGRVYSSGEPSWERKIGEADPKIFERAGGAKVYNVNTGFGIPLSTPAISRMVVVMYSGADLPEDRSVGQLCCAELGSYDPEPKWKLVVDMPSAQIVARQQRSASVGSSNSSYLNKQLDHQEEESRIATLLGDHIPLSELPGPSSESAAPFSQPGTLISHFMYLRLLLLRARDKRTSVENEAIDIIRKSYQSYTRDSQRMDKEVAFLLVRDWQFLQKQNSMPVAPAQIKKPRVVPQEAQYASYQFGIPKNLSTYSSSGGPTHMPVDLAYVNSSNAIQKISVNGAAGETLSAKVDSQGHLHNVNIVDESAD